MIRAWGGANTYLDKGPAWVFALFPVSQHPKDERLDVWDPDGALLSDDQSWLGLQVHAIGVILGNTGNGTKAGLLHGLSVLSIYKHSRTQIWAPISICRPYPRHWGHIGELRKGRVGK